MSHLVWAHAERWLTPGTEYAVPEKLPLPREWYKGWDLSAPAAPGTAASGLTEADMGDSEHVMPDSKPTRPDNLSIASDFPDSRADFSITASLIPELCKSGPQDLLTAIPTTLV